jgi:DNA-binding SARP family transcriptional activator
VAARAATTALAWHRGDAKASLDAAREGLALMGDRQVPMWQSALLVFGSFAALDLEDLPQVHRFLERLAEIAECGTPLEVSAYHVVRAHEALARGDLSAAMLAIELSLDRDRALGFSYAEGKDLQLIAYIAFELLDPQRGRDALEAARRIDEEHADPILRHWRLLIESDRALYEGKRDDATRLLKEAFQIGRERQVFSAPCPAPERLAELCRVALREGIEPEYTRALIRRRRLRANPPPVDVDDWPWPLRIHALGRVEVVVDEVSATLGRGRMLPLLIKAIVVLGGRGRGVSTSEIVALLWPDAEGDAAMRVFEVTLLRLRKQLGPHGHRAIRLEGGEVRLDKSLCWTDADALRLLLKEISALESAVPPPQSDALRTLADRLMSLWHGPFVGPHELPSVLLAIDNRTVSRAASALRRLGERLEQAGDSGVAEATYVRALEAGLCHETLLAPAVRCMKRRGDASEASALVEMYRHQGIQSDEAEVLLRAPARQVARADPKL